MSFKKRKIEKNNREGCILCSRQTSHAKLEETLANLSRPCASTGASQELEGMYFLLKIISTDKLSKLSRSFRRARARLHLGGSDIYFVPSLHKSWHYRGSDGRRMTTSRRVLWGQLNPRIPVIEYLDPPQSVIPDIRNLAKLIIQILDSRYLNNFERERSNKQDRLLRDLN